MYDVVIIGCGVVGASAAYELARYKLRVAVLEAAADIAAGTTKANSAIIHAGYDPEPGTLMARLNVEGNRLTGEICEKLQVPFKRVGSLVVAFTPEQLPTLQTLYDRGCKNGVPGLRLLSGEETRAMEPGLSEEVCGALFAPSAGIIDPWGFAIAMAETAVRGGVELRRDCPVTGIEDTGAGFVLHTPAGDVTARFVLNAAGVDADRVHEMLEPNDWHTLPSRGEYYLLDKSEHDRVSRVIFQCPGPEGKGVLVAPTIHGNLICGPNAEAVEDRLDLGNTAAGMAEVRAKAARSVPGVEWRQNIRNFAGLRANTTRSDFIIEESKAHPGFIDLAGIKSPGLSSAPAIAKMAAEMLAADGLALEPDPDFVDKREHIVFKNLSAEEKNELIRKDPRYGRVVCRCETVTEGEIVAALHSPIPPRSINGVKRRCNAGMGRCQGGFCGPRVQEIIARELGIDQAEVLLEQAGSTILTGRTKTGGNANV
ncbi:NAD(P)/FAD-dependent oxidoreductase [Allofournierella sp.]|uniref:NAD(P)/FAD-dependent oxidoreductase n=1 Tax=Allofournierella sp. TaxID=1940256 RepID=UPI002E7A6784|nr:NAD(P)/FAD-dependent oxidoreductase [Fournierella sp.]MEE0756457.1 NAD(P)/FAD-dependent oxidoreductase [Fournierella sp.]